MCSNGSLQLASAVAAACAVPVDTLTVAQLQDGVAMVSPLADRLGGWVSRAVGELAARAGGAVPAADGSGAAVPVSAWLRDATGCGGSAAGQQVRTAGLLRQLPLLADAVLDGRVGQAQAAVLTRLIGKIDLEALLEAQDGLILLAAQRDPQALAAWVREQIATHCEPVLEDQQRTAQSKRYLQTRQEPDGTVRGSFLLASEDWESVATVLEPLARRDGLADTRTAGQRRADALVEACGQVLRFGQLPDAGGLRPQISYVLPAGWAAQEAAPSLADTLTNELGQTDGPGTNGAGAGRSCARGAWSGPQTRTRIEALLCDARITRVLLDVTGQVRSLEVLSEAISKAQRIALAGRDGGCVARGCTRPPAFCDAHHLVHREDGGATTMDNLALLCRRHHVMWHQGRLLLRDLRLPWLTTTAAPPDRAAA